MTSKEKHLVMIHGLMGSSHYYNPAHRIGGFTVHTPDLLGYGSRAFACDATRFSLQMQADDIVNYIAENITDCESPVFLIGHSMGGAIGFLAAQRIPERISGFINAEGNFTLKDAYWSGQIAKQDFSSYKAEYEKMQNDPAAWLESMGSPFGNLEWANEILHNQPAETVYGMSKALVTETGTAQYENTVREVVEFPVPLYLISGEKSICGWDVPEFVLKKAVSNIVIPGAGHNMMFDAPGEFCRIVQRIVLQRENF
ncbi:MAG: alpha/beta hydrolase [Fusobacteriaceae bacterium]|nr:alpha/beta hydrolase [Fusobacteriaceae bacterium]